MGVCVCVCVCVWCVCVHERKLSARLFFLEEEETKRVVGLSPSFSKENQNRNAAGVVGQSVVWSGRP